MKRTSILILFLVSSALSFGLLYIPAKLKLDRMEVASCQFVRIQGGFSEPPWFLC